MYCVIDMETRSRVDLGTIDSHNYARHKTTEILVISVWDSVSKTFRSWSPGFDPAPKWFVDLVWGGVKAWAAQNATFEKNIWRYKLVKQYSLPLPTNWLDTQDLVLQWSLPKSLEKSTAVVFRQTQKDVFGHDLMMKMNKPGRKGEYFHTPDALARLTTYCVQDVRATVQLIERLGVGQQLERIYVQLSDRINHRGFKVDIKLLQKMRKIVESELDAAKARLTKITDGEITTPNQHARIKKLAEREGYLLASTDKAAVIEALADPKCPKLLRKVLEIRQMAGHASIGKVKKALATADRDDHRIRHSLIWNKAGTGRAAGQGFQPQNMPRGTIKLDKIKKYREMVLNDQPIPAYENKLSVISSLLRSVIIAEEGKQLYAWDYSQVEARFVLWLAGETEFCAKIAAGEPIYESMASMLFGVPVSEVTKDQRFVGKETFLGCGYGMGAAKFQSRTGVEYGLAEKAVYGYRNKFKKVPKLWKALEKAFKNTLLTKKPTFSHGLEFFMETSRVLSIRLLSGRLIRYWDPKLTAEGLTYWAVITGGKWAQVSTWGGKITENVVQGMCADLLRYSMGSLDAAEWNIILSVHDEIVCEMPTDSDPEEMKALILHKPKWAETFPLAVSGWVSPFFIKD